MRPSCPSRLQALSLLKSRQPLLPKGSPAVLRLNVHILLARSSDFRTLDMNQLFFVVLSLAVIMSVVPGGSAGLAYPHRYHKRYSSFAKHREDPITKNHVGKIARRSCRTNSSATISEIATTSTELLPTSSFIASSTATATPHIQPEVQFSPAAASSDTSASSPTSIEAAQSTSALVLTTSATLAPSSTQEPASTSPVDPTSAYAAPAQTQASTSSSTSQSDIDQYLNDQNTVRAQHGAVALTWSDTLAAAAQEWANGCVFQHSGGKLGPYGENLAAGTGSSYDISAAISSWTDEVSEYNPNDPQPSHFTQVVWKATSQVGCAVQECSGIFPASYGEAKYYVCEYYPQGNVIGEFSENVQA